MSEQNNEQQAQKTNLPVKEVIAYLATKFPLCFSVTGQALPLKQGIFQDLAEALVDDEKVSKTLLRQVLRAYTSSWRYLYACKAWAGRVDLNGAVVGVVDPQQAAHAAETLAKAKEVYNAKKAEQLKDKPKAKFRPKNQENKKRPFVKKKEPVAKASLESLAALESKFGRK